jgi:signal transduction histidine kinase/response regulator RpfG family c-di-GMP phosphodiesterase
MHDSKINILIVDDKPDKVLALEAVLEDLAQNIIRAYSGREALRCLLNQSFAVILLDVNMPGMDGFETASLIRQRPSTQDVPIIFVTAMDDETHASRGYMLGAVDYIQTPVLPEVLKTKVAVFVDLFRKSEQVRLQAESLQQRAGQLHKLTAASLAIHSASSMDQMFRVMTETARDIIGARRARVILLAQQETGRATVVCSEAELTESKQVEGYRPDGLGLHALVCRMKKPLRMSRSELESHSAAQDAGDGIGLWHAAGGWLAAPLSGRDGNNLGLVEVSEKITGEFSEEDEAILVQLAQMGSIAVENTIYAAERETNRIKDEFLSTLSHELRTPLNAILGWTQLLRLEEVQPDVKHGLEVIDRNAKAQTKLIEDLLDVSRITTGKLQLNLRPTVMGPVIQAAIDAIRPAVEAKHIQMDCPPAADTIVDADPDRLQQVFWNLFSNAVKFTPEGGRIAIDVDVRGDSVDFRVTDTGRGIDRAFLPYVFDRFRQADSTSTRSHGGLGIGLTIVRYIIQLHGGTVEADSEGEGRGAAFTVKLPVAAGRSASRVSALANSTGTGVEDFHDALKQMRILLVDDEPDAREVVATALSRAGASMTTAGSVDEAMEILTSSPIDLLISDIAMPEKDGFDLIRLLRELPSAQGGQMPAIALTAYARAEDRARALDAGFQLHLSKPVNPTSLIRAISQLQLFASGKKAKAAAAETSAEPTQATG